MQVLGKRTFMVFYAHRKILGKTYKMWTAALFLNPKKNWIFNFKIEISIFSLRTQNWDSDISKLRFRYFKIEISILAPISKKLRFRDFEREISILRSKLIFRALSIKSIVIRNFWEPMVRVYSTYIYIMDFLCIDLNILNLIIPYASIWMELRTNDFPSSIAGKGHDTAVCCRWMEHFLRSIEACPSEFNL